MFVLLLNAIADVFAQLLLDGWSQLSCAIITRSITYTIYSKIGVVREKGAFTSADSFSSLIYELILTLG
jgi:hypothetical protein